MTATGYSIADTSEEGVLGVAGMDAALRKLITGFIRPRQPGTPRFASGTRGKASWVCRMKRLRGELRQEGGYVCRSTAIQRGDRS